MLHLQVRIRYATVVCGLWAIFCIIICLLVANELRLREVNDYYYHHDNEEQFLTRPMDVNVDQKSTVSDVSNETDNAMIDFRIVVLAYNRFWSLEQSLKTLTRLNESVHCRLPYRCNTAVDVRIDRAPSGVVSERTRKVAEDFARQWSRGPASVHVHSTHAGMERQWIEAWQPRHHYNHPVTSDSELALIVEDDVDLSPYALVWLAAAHRHYGRRADISGYTLQMQNVKLLDGTFKELKGPSSDTTFLYPVLGTWGFAPHPQSWRRFLDWYSSARTNSSFKPYVAGLVVTNWYKYFEQLGSEHNIWDMWHHYYASTTAKYCVYPNLATLTGKHDVLLSRNRLEPGLHFSMIERAKMRNVTLMQLMTVWNDEYVTFPKRTTLYSINGTVVHSLN